MILASLSAAAVELVKAITAAGFLALPFLTLLAPLNWHFKKPGGSYATTYNVLGGIFASIFYSYYAFQGPNKVLLLAPLLWFFIPSVLCFVAYFALYVIYEKRVAEGKIKWPAILGLLGYIIALSIFGLLGSIVLKHKEFYMVGGRVVAGEVGVPYANLEISSESFTNSLQDQSDETGRYMLARAWKEMPSKDQVKNDRRLQVVEDSYLPYSCDINFDNHLDFQITLTSRSPTSQ